MKNENTTIADGSKVEFEGQTGHTTAYAKGWYDVTLDNGTFTKARRKQLVVLSAEIDLASDTLTLHPAETLTDLEERCDKCGNRKRSCTCSPAEAKAPVMLEITCTGCEHMWTPPDTRQENVKCPRCGTWNRVRLHPNLDNYVRGLGETANGNETLDIGDAIADLLRGLSVEDLLTEAGKRIFEFGPKAMSKTFNKQYGTRTWDPTTISEFLTERYEERNNGMIRMNVGNMLRAANKKAKALAETK